MSINSKLIEASLQMELMVPLMEKLGIEFLTTHGQTLYYDFQGAVNPYFFIGKIGTDSSRIDGWAKFELEITNA
jgi:hypothetical protein